MAGRKVLVQDDGTGHQAYVDEGPTILLSGGETTTGHFFRGPTDPADTPEFLALLGPGDEWTDTAFGPPFSHKSRNSGNDGWDIDQLILYDALGVTLGQVKVDPEGVTLAVDGASVKVSNDTVFGGPEIAIVGPNGSSVQLDSGGNILVGAGSYTADVTPDYVGFAGPGGSVVIDATNVAVVTTGTFTYNGSEVAVVP